MTTKRLTEEAIRRGLLSPTGKTPAATMSASLYVKGTSVGITRLSEPGLTRARRGSVRWVLGP